MKATIEIPDDLYRQVKAKSALEGRAVREVTEELFRRYVSRDQAAEPHGESPAQPLLGEGRPGPAWFGALGKYARRVKRHEWSAIRDSIGKGIARDRDL